jgi:hypothetical protein
MPRKNRWRELIADLRKHGRNACPFHMTFVECGLTVEGKREVEAKLKEMFDRWWESWIVPLIDEIEKKTVKKGKEAR